MCLQCQFSLDDGCANILSFTCRVTSFKRGAHFVNKRKVNADLLDLLM